MTSGTKKRLLLALKLFVGLALTVALIKYASLPGIARAFQAADQSLLLMGMSLIPIGMWLNARQLKFLTDCHSMNVGLARIIGINAITEFYNLFLPGVIAGGAIRWLRLSQGNQLRTEAFAVIVANRLLGLLVLLVLGVLGWLSEFGYTDSALPFAFLCACLVALSLTIATLSNPKVSAAARAKLEASTRIKPYLRNVLLKLIAASNEFRTISGIDRLLVVAYAASWHIVILFSTYLFGLALHLDVQFTSLVWIRAIVTIALLAPITISGFGIREASWVYFLGLYGVAAADAFALSLLTFARQAIQAVIGGTLEIYAFLSYKTV